MKKRTKARDGIYQRPGKAGPVWWYTITHHGRRERTVVGPVASLTRDEVATARNLRIANLIRDDHEIPAPRRSLSLEALRKAFLESLPEASDRRAKADRYLGHLSRVLGASTAAEKLSLIQLLSYRKARLAEKIRGYKDATRTVGQTTVNRELVGLRIALRWAKRKGLIRSHVFDQMDRSDRRSAFAREQARALPERLSDEAIGNVSEALPPECRALPRFAVLTGMRREEILGLTWDQVHESEAIPFARPTRTKSGKPRKVPLCAEAVKLLPARPAEGGLVFIGNEGKGLSASFGRLWSAARTTAKAPGLRFHDLRHEWASRFTDAGGDLRTLQAIGGWSSLSLVERYSHPTEERAIAVLNRASKKGGNVVRIATNRAQKTGA